MVVSGIVLGLGRGHASGDDVSLESTGPFWNTIFGNDPAAAAEARVDVFERTLQVSEAASSWFLFFTFSLGMNN